MDEITLSDGSAGTGVSLFRITHVLFDAAAQRNTHLRWIDTGADYEIVASDDLVFGDPEDLVIPVNADHGTLDFSTDPSELHFSFDDPGATGARRFWQVRQVLP